MNGLLTTFETPRCGIGSRMATFYSASEDWAIAKVKTHPGLILVNGSPSHRKVLSSVPGIVDEVVGRVLRVDLISIINLGEHTEKLRTKESDSMMKSLFRLKPNTSIKVKQCKSKLVFLKLFFQSLGLSDKLISSISLFL